MPSYVSFSEITPKPTASTQDRASLGARVGLALFGLSIILVTSALIVIGTSDEPRPTRVAAAANASSGSTSNGEAWREPGAAPPPAPEAAPANSAGRNAKPSAAKKP